MLSLALRWRLGDDLGELGNIERFGSNAYTRGREALLMSPVNELTIGCGPREKEDPIELLFRDVWGKRGTGGMMNAPAGGGVEAIV